MNGYYDTRDFAVVTLNVLANLPGRLQYFSLTNYTNAVGADPRRDFDTYYTEQNLRWGPLPSVPLDLMTQWVHRSGGKNDMLRFGLRWRLMNTSVLDTWFKAINLMYFVNVHAYQFDFSDALAIACKSSTCTGFRSRLGRWASACIWAGL